MKDADFDGVLGLGRMHGAGDRERQTRGGSEPPAGIRSLRDRLH